MSEDIAEARRGLEIDLLSQELRKFQPQETRRQLVTLNKLIELAAELQEWPMLDQAIGLKFEEICDLLIYWHRMVSTHWGGDRSKYAERDTCSFRDLEKQTGIKQPQISRWNAAVGLAWEGDDPAIDPEKRDAFCQKIRQAARRKAGLEPEPNRVSPNTGEYEWYTPAEYIAAAREVMGGIDLDPATHLAAQRVVQATQFYTKADNGLLLSWHGRVWLNPPYSQPLIGRFIDKLGTEYASGSVEQAIMVTNNCTDTGWFHGAVQRDVACMCFTLGRIRFANPERPSGESPLQGQTFFYYGPQGARFQQVFKAFGFCVVPV